MPIYEYLCRTCQKRSAILTLNPRTSPAARCSYCGSHQMERLLSRFAALKSEEARLESLAESDDLEGFDENDPESVSRFMNTMGQEMGEDVGEEMEALMDQQEDQEDAVESADDQ